MILGTHNWHAVLAADRPLWKHDHHDHYRATWHIGENIYTVTYEFPTAPVRVLGDAATLRDADDLVYDDWAAEEQQAAYEVELDRRGHL